MISVRKKLAVDDSLFLYTLLWSYMMSRLITGTSMLTSCHTKMEFVMK